MDTLPKSLERLDLRANTIGIMDDILTQLESKDSPRSNLVFFTNFGIVSGKLVHLTVDDEQQDKSFFEALMLKTIEFRKSDITEHEENHKNFRLVNDSSFIILSDANITPYTLPSTHHKVSDLVLFTDQIVGVSVGEMSLKQSET